MMNIKNPIEKYDLSNDAVVSGPEPITTEKLERIDMSFDEIVINEA